MRVFFAAAFCCGLLGTAWAHPLAPASLELREEQPGRLLVHWRVPLGPAGSGVTAELPAHCEAHATEPPVIEDDARVQRWRAACDAAGLAGATVGVAGLAPAGIAAVLRIETHGGQTHQALLTADRPAYRVPSRATAGEVIGQFLRAGAQHLLTGLDHLLFIAGLVFLVRGLRPLVLTVTAFTIGHSLTLACAAYGLVAFDERLIELGIALSLLALAARLVAAHPRARTWWLAGPFGLLHGLGFAGALGTGGLSAGGIPIALAAFNLGIELAQLALVGALLLVRASLVHLPWRWQLGSAATACAYVTGSLASMWIFERAAAWLPRTGGLS